jgi:hypothetical protein
MSKWVLHCTNPNCGYFAEQQTFEPDVICRRCGAFVEVNEKITFRETDKEDKSNNDLCSN